MAHVVDTSIIDSCLANLKEMREFGGDALTIGLSTDVVRDFLENGYRELAVAIQRGYENFVGYQDTHADFLALSEADQIARAHSGLTNFYAVDAVNPYVAVSASGPWIVSLKGAVIYDCGGYGMLGLGHAPEEILAAMNQPHVMANIMTANISQVDFVDRLNREIGHTRTGGVPYASFLCLNSGSEANSLASRLVDFNTRQLTDPGARFAGSNVHGLTLRGSFHGRTDRPAQFSDSCAETYKKHLASYRNTDYLLTVEPNNIEELEAVFQHAARGGLSACREKWRIH
jgi:4-aminobutyrate aminotransferase-like enzyme